MDKGKYNILGVQINVIDYDAALEKIISAAKNKQSFGVTALAVHGVMTGALDKVQRYRINQLDLAVPDGQPVRWALNILYHSGLKARVYGPRLMLEACKIAAREALPIFLYGGEEKVLSDLQSELIKRFPDLKIAGYKPSRFRLVSPEEEQNDIEEIIESGAQIVFVGLGCPRQETWVYEHLTRLPMPMVAVGAAFDFHSGKLPQAPNWMQARGLEWLFRLVQEPRRLWKRYLVLSPIYLIFVGLQWTGLHILKPEDSLQPPESVRYG